MTRLILVRHGEAAAGWADDLDPGLSDLGQRQAQEVVDELAPLGPLPIFTSPLRRCQETSQPLAHRWDVVPHIQPRVGEIESPGQDLTTRGQWLAGILGDRWTNLDDPLLRWRDEVIERLVTFPDDCVVFTHFVAINVAIGHATGDDRVVCRRVANCGTATFETDGHSLVLVAEPDEAVHTEVL